MIFASLCIEKVVWLALSEEEKKLKIDCLSVLLLLSHLYAQPLAARNKFTLVLWDLLKGLLGNERCRIKDGNKSICGGRVDLKTFTTYSNYWNAKNVTVQHSMSLVVYSAACSSLTHISIYVTANQWVVALSLYRTQSPLLRCRTVAGVFAGSLTHVLPSSIHQNTEYMCTETEALQTKSHISMISIVVVSLPWAAVE